MAEHNPTALLPDGFSGIGVQTDRSAFTRVRGQSDMKMAAPPNGVSIVQPFCRATTRIYAPSPCDAG